MPASKKDEQPALPINVLREGSAPKLNPNSDDLLTYEIGIHEETKQLHIRIAGNSGGGYFSEEWIPLERIEDCFGDGFDKKASFSSTILRPAFVEGKSANNAGFLAAVLRKETLFSPDEERQYKHYLTGDFGKWKQAQLAGQSKKPAKPATSSSN